MRRILLATVWATPIVACCAAANAQPVTGLYVGGGGGGNFLQQEQVRTNLPGVPTQYGRIGFDAGYVGLASVGYGFGNGLRAEIEGDYRHNKLSANIAGAAVNGREQKYGGMANLLFDLDVGSPYIYPYIGGGVGYQRVENRTDILSSGLRATIDGSDSGFAYQAIAGVSLPIPPVVGLSLTVEYRYFSVNGSRSYPASYVAPGVAAGGSLANKADVNHDVMVGLRYAFNVAPPPPPAATVTPPPSAQPSRTYLVFFDWDRADLTPRARQVVGEAAQASTRIQVTRIEVNGYTDTSGTPQYNRGLSLRRAQTVADELVRDGVPRPAIAIQGFGETHLLVPTADRVREPQNRRVEIILK